MENHENVQTSFIIKKTQMILAVEKQELSDITGGNANHYSPSGGELGNA